MDSALLNSKRAGKLETINVMYSNVVIIGRDCVLFCNKVDTLSLLKRYWSAKNKFLRDIPVSRQLTYSWKFGRIVL